MPKIRYLKEIWRETQCKWEVSNLGKVRNKKSQKVLKLRLRKDGYLDVKLSYSRFLVHRLVAIAFIKNPIGLLQVNHLDGNRANPAVSNLEWVDQFMNMRHAIASGLFPDRKGIKNGRATITKDVAIQIKNYINIGISNKDIAKELKVSYSVVTNIKRGVAWKWLEV